MAQPEPVTQLDERFSAPTAEAVPWAEALHELERAKIFWISTVRADGRPHVTPLIAVWFEDALVFTTGPQEQKAVNLAGNAAVVLTTGTNAYDHGLDVVVEGTAQRVTERAQLERIVDAYVAKYAEEWRFEIQGECFSHGGEHRAYVYRVAPDKVLGFGRRPFSHTRWTFC